MKTYRQILEGKLPPKGTLDKAVKAMQLYLGSLDKTRISDQQKLRNKLDGMINKIAKSTGNDESNIWNQLESEARKRGVTTPIPGKDI